mmetsp:Transcript_173275/g.421463  ORF Transcript_173275/g.421463 Transcript_173275/m.421463 type:complete len:347 (+) Transcript_173275:426-1466(+)
MAARAVAEVQLLATARAVVRPAVLRHASLWLGRRGIAGVARPALSPATKAPAADVSNQLGVHALVWTGGWSEADARDACARTKAAGYDLIEIPILNPSSVDAEMTRQVLHEYGLGVATSLGLTFGTDVSSEDDAVVARGEALLNDALATAAGIGAKYMCGILYSALGKYATKPTLKGRTNAVGAIKRLAVKADAMGVTLGLEVVNRYETNLLNTAEQAVAFVSDVDEPNVVVHLDSYHMNIEEKSLKRAVLICGDKLGYVHVGESDRGALGTGTVDFDGLFEGLAEVGYAGPITFESFSSEVVAPGLSELLCIWRNPWSYEQRDELAVAARTYTLEMMERFRKPVK